MEWRLEGRMLFSEAQIEDFKFSNLVETQSGVCCPLQSADDDDDHPCSSRRGIFL